jgi:hypothetical protein
MAFSQRDKTLIRFVAGTKAWHLLQMPGFFALIFLGIYG